MRGVERNRRTCISAATAEKSVKQSAKPCTKAAGTPAPAAKAPAAKAPAAAAKAPAAALQKK
jgi:hypothetical protein